MKEQWKKLDSDAKLLVNVEEGRNLPIKIELPLSAFVSNNNDCCKRLLTILRVSILLVALIFLAWTATVMYSEYYQQSQEFNNQPFIVNEPFKNEDNKLSFNDKIDQLPKKPIDEETNQPLIVNEPFKNEDNKLTFNDEIYQLPQKPIDYISYSTEEPKQWFQQDDDLTENSSPTLKILSDNVAKEESTDSKPLKSPVEPFTVNNHESFESNQNSIEIIKALLEKTIKVKTLTDLSNEKNSDEKVIFQEEIKNSEEELNDEFMNIIVQNILSSLVLGDQVNNENNKSEENVSKTSNEETGNSQENPWITDQEKIDRTWLVNRIVTSSEEVINNSKEKLDDIVKKLITNIVNVFDQESEEREESLNMIENTTSQQKNILVEFNNNFNTKSKSNLQNSDDSVESYFINQSEEKIVKATTENLDYLVDDSLPYIIDDKAVTSSEEDAGQSEELNFPVEQLILNIVSAFNQGSEENMESDEIVDANSREKNVLEINSEESNISDDEKTINPIENSDAKIIQPNNRSEFEEKKEEINNKNTSSEQQRIDNSEEIESTEKNFSVEEKDSISLTSTENIMREIEKIRPVEQKGITTLLAKRLAPIVGENGELLSWYYENKDNPNFVDYNDPLKVYTAKLLFSTNIEQYSMDVSKVIDLVMDDAYTEDFRKLLDPEEKKIEPETFIQNYIVDRLMMKSSMSNRVEEGTVTPEIISISLQNINLLELSQTKDGIEIFFENSGETEEHRQSILQVMRAVAHMYDESYSPEDTSDIDGTNEIEDLSNESQNDSFEKKTENVAEKASEESESKLQIRDEIISEEKFENQKNEELEKIDKISSKENSNESENDEGSTNDEQKFEQKPSFTNDKQEMEQERNISNFAEDKSELSGNSDLEKKLEWFVKAKEFNNYDITDEYEEESKDYVEGYDGFY